MTGDAEPKQVIFFQDDEGKEPLWVWLNRLRDKAVRLRIFTCIGKLEQGNLGKCDPVGEGVSELKMDFGPGYRIYFGDDGDRIVVLLCGGDKDSQKRDIDRAKRYWKEYKADAKI